MIGQPWDRDAVLEDLTFLADLKVGASEAAHRLGFTNAIALDKWLRRWGHNQLATQLARQDWAPIEPRLGPQRFLRRAS